ncbi:hypothetical protein ACEPAG_4079 [Sanghuangporus baumii]
MEIVHTFSDQRSRRVHVDGELIRSVVTEDQEGVPLYADVEVIDVNTCEPVSRSYNDFWHANATGVYSGVVASGYGVGSDDPANINNTFLRGIQEISKEGYAIRPYNTNAQELTENSEDGILALDADSINPMIEHVLLGDGILAWSSLSIDTSASYTVSSAATLTEDGGVANENSGPSGAGPGASGSVFPIGAIRSGSDAAIPSESACGRRRTFVNNLPS